MKRESALPAVIPPTISVTVDRNKEERKSCFRRFKSGTSYQWQVVKAHPRIGCVTLTIFMILCGIGLGVVYGIRHQHITEFEDQGLQLAQDTGDFFCTYAQDWDGGRGGACFEFGILHVCYESNLSLILCLFPFPDFLCFFGIFQQNYA
jgi:hypothetical protein